MKNRLITLLIISMGFVFTQEFDVDGDLKVSGDIIFEDETTQNTAATGMPIGTIITFAGSTPPEGWLLCDGTELPAGAEYDQLDTVLDGIYGQGSRSNVPDFQGRMPYGADENHGLATTGGVSNISTTHLPDHGHTTSSGGNHSHVITIGHTNGAVDNGSFTYPLHDNGVASHPFYSNTTGNHSHTTDVCTGCNQDEFLPPFLSMPIIMVGL